MTKLSVVVPFYKSPETVFPLYEGIKSSCEPIFDELEIIFVEDCGYDGTWEKIEDLAERDKRVKAVQLSRNCGQHIAISAGMKEASGDWVVVMDCDLQDDPADISLLYTKAREGFDVVSLLRVNRQDGRFKRWSSWLFAKTFYLLSGIPQDNRAANFRIMSRKVAAVVKDFHEENRIIGTHLHWIGFAQTAIEGHHHKRPFGHTSYSFFKLCRQATQAIFTSTNRPLMLSIALGAICFGLAVCAIFYLVYRKLFWGIPIEGWTAIMVSIWFLGGLVLLMLGILGIYIGKLFDAAKGRPPYIIARAKNLDGNKPFF